MPSPSPEEQHNVEDMRTAAYEDQPHHHHDVFGDTQTEPSVLQPSQRSGSTVFDSHHPHPVSITQVPAGIAADNPSE